MNNKVMERYTSFTKLFAFTIDKTNFVNKINCNYCNSIYMGQTSRQLIRRIRKHVTRINNNKNTTALAQHAHQYSHRFDFSLVEILPTDENYLKRLLLEMINI